MINKYKYIAVIIIMMLVVTQVCPPSFAFSGGSAHPGYRADEIEKEKTKINEADFPRMHVPNGAPQPRKEAGAANANATAAALFNAGYSPTEAATAMGNNFLLSEIVVGMLRAGYTEETTRTALLDAGYNPVQVGDVMRPFIAQQTIPAVDIGDEVEEAVEISYDGVLSDWELTYDYASDTVSNVRDGYEVAATSTNGDVVSSPTYNDNGRVIASSTYSLDGIISGYTVFDDFGLALATYDNKGRLVTKYIYNKYGNIIRQDNYGLNDQRKWVKLGYTTFDKFGRARDIYTLCPDGKYRLTARNIYNKYGQLAKTLSYSYTDGGTRVYTGYTSYDKYGRQAATYNAQGHLTSRFYYAKGMLKEVRQFGRGNTYLGKTTYDVHGRQVRSYNHRNMLTAVYIYDSEGILLRTDNYAAGHYNGYTTYSVTGKAGTTFNRYGEIIARNHYNKYGTLTSTTNYGRNGHAMGETHYDAYGRETYTLNAQGHKTEQKFYGSDGFISYSYTYNDGHITAKTVFDNYGRASETFKVHDGRTTPFAITRYIYDPHTGLLEKTMNYGRHGKYIGYTTFNVFGEQTAKYSQHGTKVETYHYERGFLVSSHTNYEFKESSGTWKEAKHATTTYYDAASRPTHVVNEHGVTVSRFEYNSHGFLHKVLNYNEHNGNYAGYVSVGSNGQFIASYNSHGHHEHTFRYDEYGFSLK